MENALQRYPADNDYVNSNPEALASIMLSSGQRD